ncbi:MAG: hypothetical protein K5666_00075 [Bacilli bacterium]|nr:hypothetical protein [Bacilli bacterium]
MEKEKNNKKTTKEFIPLVIASTILLLLIVALVYTIVYKPKISIKGNIENSLKTDELAIGNVTYVCEGKDVNKLKEEANNIVVAYEELDNYFLGKVENMDADPDDPDGGLKDAYGLALRTKFYGITDDIYIKVNNITLDEQVTLKKSDVTKDGYAKYDKINNLQQNKVNVKVYINDDNCSNVLLREFEVTLPRYNTLIDLPVCAKDEYKNTETCNKFVFNSNSYKEDLEISKKEVSKVEKKNESNKDKKNSSVGYIIAIAVIVIVVVISVMLLKGRMKHEK